MPKNSGWNLMNLEHVRVQHKGHKLYPTLGHQWNYHNEAPHAHRMVM